MANFKYYENDFELAVLELLSNAGWEYECGYDIHRETDDVILLDDFREYLTRRYGHFSDAEIDTLISYMTGFANQSLYRSMKETYKLLQKGCFLHRDNGSEQFIDFFEYGKEAETINIFKAVNLDRKLFSKIRSNKGYMPSKRTALALAVALELSLGETDGLLKRAGYALSHAVKFDVIVEYFITNGKYDVFKINEVLFEYDQPLLGGY